MGCGAPRAAELGALRTGDIPGLANDFVGVECGEDAPLSRPHVVAAVPVVVLLQLHQDGVVHVQLQLILVARDEPVRAGGRAGGETPLVAPWPWGGERPQGDVALRCSPEHGAVGLLALLSVHHAGEQPEGLRAWRRGREHHPGAEDPRHNSRPRRESPR